MPRYYNPATGTEALEGIHDTNNATSETDMTEESREWFKRPARNGMRWKTDPTGKFPVEIPIPPPTTEELKARERAWSAAELAATDLAMLPDSPYSASERESIQTYRASLRNPAREATEAYPDPSWRPVFPAGVKHPSES